MKIINKIKGLNDKSLTDLVNWVGVPSQVESIEFRQIRADKHDKRLLGRCCHIEGHSFLILVCEATIDREQFLETLVHEIKHIEHFYKDLISEVEEAEAEAEEQRLNKIA